MSLAIEISGFWNFFKVSKTKAARRKGFSARCDRFGGLYFFALFRKRETNHNGLGAACDKGAVCGQIFRVKIFFSAVHGKKGIFPQKGGDFE